MKHPSSTRTPGKRFFPACVCILLLLSAGSCSKDETAAPSPTFESRTEGVFPGMGAAKVKLNDSFAQIRSIHGDPDTRGGYPTGDSTKYSTYSITYTSKGIIVYLKDVAYPAGPKDSDIAEEVVVMAPYGVKTDRGIGIGSSTTDVVAAYGQPGSITTIGNRTWYEYRSRGVDFEIQFPTVVRIGIYTPR